MVTDIEHVQRQRTRASIARSRGEMTRRAHDHG